MDEFDQPALRGLIRGTTRRQTRTKSIKIPQKAFEVDESSKPTGFVHKVLVHFGIRDEDPEEVNEQEKQRKIKIAIEGWKKVKKVVNLIKFQGADKFISKNLPKDVIPWWHYDSLVILPNSKFAFVWNTLKAFFNLYNFLLVPFRDSYINFDRGLVRTDYVIDSFYLLDIIFGFFKGFNKRTKVIKSKKEIILNYLLGWFAFDVLPIIPYYWTNDEYGVYGIRFVRFVQLPWTLKCMRDFWERFLLFLTSNINIIKSLSAILNFTFFLLIIGNLLSCFWYLLGIEQDVYSGYDYALDQAVYEDGWISHFILNTGEGTRYITSLYWTFTTLSTLGYGDIYGRTNSEYLYSMFVEFVGVFTFAYMMSNINSLIQKLNDDPAELIENKSTELDQWILKLDRANVDKALPSDLFKKIKDFFMNYWLKDHTMLHSDDPFLHQLPRDLKSRLIKHLFKDFFQKYHIFFDGLEQAFCDEIVIHLIPRSFEKDTDIIKIDHGAKYVYFILSGSVLSKFLINYSETYVTLPQNTYFGEHLIFFNLRSSNAFRAIGGPVECLCLPKNKFIEICSEFPESSRVLRKRACARRKEFRMAKIEYQKVHKGTLPTYRYPTYVSIQKIDEGETNLEFMKNVEEHPSRVLPGANLNQDTVLSKAKHLKALLDRVEHQINDVETELNKKMKNIKYYIGYISTMEETTAAN